MLRKSPGDYGAVILVHVLRDHSFLFSLDSCGAVGALLLGSWLCRLNYIKEDMNGAPSTRRLFVLCGFFVGRVGVA